MPQEWENGNAARQPACDESNPFAPIDYAARLQHSGRRRRQDRSAAYRPGQMYAPPAPSAPPMAAPEYEAPSYLQPQQADGFAPGEVGAPYSNALFTHEPTAVMPQGWNAAAFAAPPVQPQQEAPQDPQPVYYAPADIPMRDPFTPAAPHEETVSPKAPPRAEKPRRQRSPLRLDRLLALLAAGLLLGICAVVLGRMVMDLLRNEREMEAFRSEYLEQNGVEVVHGAARVDLLPQGQTYAPTATPAPTAALPTPTPVIPVYGALGLSQSQSDPQPQATDAPPLRTRLSAYPKNPMCNMNESLREMVAQNSDVIGRLVIPGVLDEMVMQRNNTYYLTHNAAGSACEYGAVFADQSCSLRLPPENLLLRGQGGVPGKAFAPLWQYVSGGSAFVSANMLARLTTLYEEETYVLFAVIVTDGNAGGDHSFNYASNPSFTTDEAMLRYVESARQHSAYQFHVDVAASDRLLTLATLGNGSNTLVLMYRMVRENESMGL